MKVAIVYDRVNKWGGAERVLLYLHELFPDAPLYTSVYDQKNAAWARAFPKVVTSFLQRITFLRNKHELLGTFMPLIFESFNFDQYDLVISVTSEAAKGIITKPRTKHLCYCLTPTRYLWNDYETYFPKRSFLRFVAGPVVNYLRWWEKVAAFRPDKIVAISAEVAQRIKCYYNREAVIVYPPVSPIKTVNKVQKATKITENYYLVVSRLVKYKRVDIVIRAFNLLGWKLLVIGKGAEQKKLRKIAKGNISFTDAVTDTQLANYYQGAKGLIFPQEEDFGIVAVEAMTFGVPVIAYKKGGALDIVNENKNGIFFNEQTVKCLTQALKKFEEQRFSRNIIINGVKKFSKEVFKSKILGIINKSLS